MSYFHRKTGKTSFVFVYYKMQHKANSHITSQLLQYDTTGKTSRHCRPMNNVQPTRYSGDLKMKYTATQIKRLHFTFLTNK